MFDWISDAIDWIGDGISSLWDNTIGSAVDTITDAIWDVMFEWLFNLIYGAVADLFEFINASTSSIFALSWVQSFIALFHSLAWMLFVCGLIVAVFDTAFHQTMPAKAYMYALPYEYYENDKVRRYGFHGTSHKYVSQRAAAMLGKKPEELKLISCHLGNGSSVTAVDGGKSVDTSMGFTPLAGLPMGTRAGDLDAGILQYLMNKYDMNIDTMLDILNKKSGVQGVSGVSSDFRDLENAHKEGNERAGLAVDMFNYGVKKLIGAYAAAMGGVDAIIFTAGVGENSASQRLDIASGLEFMGVKMDAEANNVRGKEAVISAADSKVKVLLIPTNEELMIAMDTASIVKG